MSSGDPDIPTTQVNCYICGQPNTVAMGNDDILDMVLHDDCRIKAVQILQDLHLTQKMATTHLGASEADILSDAEDDGQADSEGHHLTPWDAATSTYESRAHGSRYATPESLDERQFFPLAMKFLSTCTMQLEPPKPAFNVGSTKGEHHKRIYQLIALLLASGAKAVDVTAVAAYFRFEQDPPLFKMYYTKNRHLTKDDRLRASDLAKIINEVGEKEASEFLDEIYGFIHAHSSPKFQRMCRDFLGDAPSVAVSLAVYIKSKRNQEWQAKVSSTAGDATIVEEAKKAGISNLEAMLAVVIAMVSTANRAQVTLETSDIRALCGYAFVLRTSSLFARFVVRMERLADRVTAFKFFDNLKILAVYYDATHLLHSYLRKDEYASKANHFELIGRDPLSPDEIKKVCENEKYSVWGISCRTESSKSDAAKDSKTSAAQAASQPDPIDYLTFLRARADATGAKPPAGRSAWEIHYPKLLDWTGVADAKEYVHAEISLALNLMLDDCTGTIYLSVSKQPCYLCETWLTTLNHTIHDPTFLIPEGHKKVYDGWKLPGVNGIDGAVISEVWERFDDLAASVRYVDTSDTVITLYSTEDTEPQLQVSEAELIQKHTSKLGMGWSVEEIVNEMNDVSIKPPIQGEKQIPKVKSLKKKGTVTPVWNFS